MKQNVTDYSISKKIIKIDYTKEKPQIEFKLPAETKHKKVNRFLDILSSFRFCFIYLLSIPLILLFTYYGYKDFRLFMHQREYASLFLLYVLFIFVISLIFFKKLVSFQAKFFGGLKKSKRVAIFDKDSKILKEDDKLFYEIPMFNNDRLDYEATEDFSENLTIFEVDKNPLLIKLWKKTKNKDGKEIITYKRTPSYYWRARFYYKDIPKSGELKVWFK
jgi:hypothetical protein